MSAQPQPQAQPFTDYNARTYNKNHQQVQHIINRILQLLEVPNKAARTINGIHGMLNGIDKSKFPVFRSHQFVALQMDFRGQPSNSDVFMSRALAALDNAESKCGRSFFKITRADGITQKITSYDADYLSDAAEWTLVQVKNSPDYFKNPAKAVTDQILWDAINKFLPERPPEPPKDDGAGGPSITDGEIIKAQWTRLLNAAEQNLIRELESGADPVLAARAVAAKITDMGKRIKDRFARERLSAFSSIGEEDDCDLEREGSGKYTSDTFSPPTPNDAEEFADSRNPTATPQTDEGADYGWSSPPPQTVRVNCENPKENESFSPDTPPNMLEWALNWAGMGIPVFPLHEVYDDICTCSCSPKKCRNGQHGCGSECTSKGKHPRTRNGKDDATTDVEQIKAWWRKWPTANIGGRMGGKLRLLALDVDPKHGGDASLCDLADAHGDEWLDTRSHETGTLGTHLFYDLPEGLELPNTASKIAPGIDTRAGDGYVVLPPSLHATGRNYRVVNAKPARPAPAWLIGELTRTPDQPPAKVIDFQERRAPAGAFGSRVFQEGERNDGLRDVACGRWLNGWATDAQDLFEQLREVRDTRCAPGNTPPPSDPELNDLAQRTTRKYARGDLKREAQL